jgi:FKBP-type peptidyl-prolyl cis-trans isomerase
MKLLPLLLAALALTAVSGLSQAEIYKWKDKDGNVRYSDTPPPSNVKQESMSGKKKVQAPTGSAPLSPVENPATAAVPKVMPKDVEPPKNPEDAAAEQRQRNAEAEKNNKKEKEADAKRKAENCTSAKANMQTYTQGGRVYKMNEKGEREYMDESGFKAGREKAQQEINENC